MSDIINFNKFKKEKAKADKEARAKNNRVLFGTPKFLKEKIKKLNLIEQKRLLEKQFEKDKDSEK